MSRQLSRRSLLAAMGVSSMFLPLLAPREARSQPYVKPKRFIVIAVPNGVKEEVYWPTGTRFDWTIPADAQVPTAHRHSPLSPLLPHKNELVFLGGLALQNGKDTAGGGLGGHAALPFLLTGARGVDGPEISDGLRKSAGGPSIDRFIGKTLAQRHKLPIDSLVLAPVPKFRGNDGYLSFDGPPIGGVPNAPTHRTNPIQLFDDLFGSQDLDDTQLARQRLRRRSVLDLVGKQLERHATHVGSEDRQRVEAHLTAIRDLEKQLGGLSASCAPPLLGLDSSLNYDTDNGNPNIDKIIRAQIDTTVAAMACDMTRVASMVWSDQGNGRFVFHWLGSEFTKQGTDFANAGENQGLRNHHEIAHRDGDPEYQPLMNRACQWYIEQYAYLLQKLKETLDPDGKPMLDSTVVLFANLQRTGGGHQTDNLPWLLAGSASGYFRTNQFLAWPSGTQGTSAPQNGVLAAICNAMDVPVDYYGSADYGGEFSALKA